MLQINVPTHEEKLQMFMKERTQHGLICITMPPLGTITVPSLPPETADPRVLVLVVFSIVGQIHYELKHAVATSAPAYGPEGHSDNPYPELPPRTLFAVDRSDSLSRMILADCKSPTIVLVSSMHPRVFSDSYSALFLSLASCLLFSLSLPCLCTLHTLSYIGLQA